MQPKVIKSTSKYLGMLQWGKLSQPLSESLSFKGSLNIPTYQGHKFLECDRNKSIKSQSAEGLLK